MDPLVKAHMRIAALEQQLQDPARIKAEMGSSFSSHYLRVVPLPGDRILCAEMDESMTVLDLSIHTDEETAKVKGYVLSGVRVAGLQHTCRPETCLDTIRIQRHGRGDFEQSLLRAEFGKGNEE